MGTLRTMYKLTPGEYEAIAVTMHAFYPKQSCASAVSLRFLYVIGPVAPLTPQQAAAIDSLRRVGWATILHHEYVLCHGEWYAP